MPKSERRLAAIMFTDVVGFTALAHADEAATVALLEDQRKLLRPVFASHGGREVKTIGDAFLVEFESALEATLCAIAIQNMMNDRKVARGEGMPLRIGIHVGDVIESENDVLGDAVNIASRVEPLAEPGGICVSQQVYDQVHNKVRYPMQRLPPKELKNVNEQIGVFKVVLPWEKAGATQGNGSQDPRRVAVLPLVSLSPDPNDEYFADGMTEEMISALSNIGSLTVISRTSAMQYKGAKKSLTEIGRELKAGTILEGSVRKGGSRVRITFQLIDAIEDRHLWAQNYDRELQDIFVVQSDVAKMVADALSVRLLADEASQIRLSPTKSAEAHILYLKGRAQWNKRSLESMKKAIEYFDLAIEQDPDYALAYVGLSDCYNALSDHDYITATEAVEMGRPAVMKALELNGKLAEAHASYGWGLASFDWDWDAAVAEFKRAIELNGNYATAHQWYSIILRDRGQLEESLVEARKALDLDPLSPIVTMNVGERFHVLERYDEAVEYYKRALELEPDFIPAISSMALSYAMKGDAGMAMSWVDRLSKTSMPPSMVTVLRSALLARAGKRREALDMLDSTMRVDSERVPKSWPAWVYAAVNDEGRAIEVLEKAVEARDTNLLYIKTEPWFKDLRESPGFKAILGKLNLL